LEWSTFLGGSDFDAALGIAASGGNVFVTGQTVSYDFPFILQDPTCAQYQCAPYPIGPGSVFLVQLK
jgi:hypothetical protein